MVSPIDSTLRACAKANLVIVVKCRACGREGLFDSGWLARKMNPLSDIRRLKFRCDGCRSREVDVRAAPYDWR